MASPPPPTMSARPCRRRSHVGTISRRGGPAGTEDCPPGPWRGRTVPRVLVLDGVGAVRMSRTRRPPDAAGDVALVSGPATTAQLPVPCRCPSRGGHRADGTAAVVQEYLRPGAPAARGRPGDTALAVRSAGRRGRRSPGTASGTPSLPRTVDAVRMRAGTGTARRCGTPTVTGCGTGSGRGTSGVSAAPFRTRRGLLGTLVQWTEDRWWPVLVHGDLAEPTCAGSEPARHGP